MNLTPLNLQTFQFGQALPFALRAQDGTLLAAKGFTVTSRAQLEMMVTRAGVLCIDLSESPEQARAFMSQLDVMVRTERTIGQIAATEMKGTPSLANGAREGNAPQKRFVAPDWQEMQLRATALLKSPGTADFLPRLERLQGELEACSAHQPDASLFALIHFAARELTMYSATHGMLVAVVCGMAARDTLKWEPEVVDTVVKTALTMNIAMTALQDVLALQTAPLTEAQGIAIAAHAEASARLLENQGITDALWLGAVRRHHEPPSGRLQEMDPTMRIARLVERADIFAARLAPRASRSALPAAVAMRATYFDDAHRVDEAGASLITAMGVYPPGSFVKLTSNETAIVLKRGATGTMPKVAVVLNRQGTPIGEMVVRDTSQAAFKVMSSVAHREVRVQLSLERMLAMI